MDIQSGMIWTYSVVVAGRAKTRRDAFADPLERPEWQGLGWVVTLISKLVSGGRALEPGTVKTQAVDRFTETADARSVCVS